MFCNKILCIICIHKNQLSKIKFNSTSLLEFCKYELCGKLFISNKNFTNIFNKNSNLLEYENNLHYSR